jgi:histidinol-phosphatase
VIRTIVSEDLRLAWELADAADEITMARFRADDLVVDTKPDMTPVSEADRAVEQRVRGLLAQRRPGDALLGEEFGGDALPGGRRWIIDPIDGTKGYVRGMPVWATLLALEEEGEVTAAVVSAPAMGRRWWATRGHGAFTNRDSAVEQSRPLRVSAIERLEDAQVCYGDLDLYERTGRLDGLLALILGCWRARGFGEFWQYMLVAEGVAEVASDPAAKLWDFAAPMLVVQEAGGRFSDFTGLETAAGGSGLASNALLHDAALTILTGT